MFLNEIAVPNRTVDISTFRGSYEKGTIRDLFCVTQCALQGDAKNVTAVTMSQGIVTGALARLPHRHDHSICDGRHISV